MFTEAVEGLDEKLREGAAFLGEPPAPLLLALALLAGACAHSIVRNALPQLLPWLLAALRALTQGPLADGSALQAALACVRSSLAEEAGDNRHALRTRHSWVCRDAIEVTAVGRVPCGGSALTVPALCQLP